MRMSSVFYTRACALAASRAIIRPGSSQSPTEAHRRGIMLVIVLTLLAASLSNAYECHEQSITSWNLFVFVELSPGADCYKLNGQQNSSVLPLTPNWTMHGMWPSTENGRNNPQYCNTSNAFDVTKLEDLLPQLMRDWPTLLPPRDWDSCCPRNLTEYMWCHEWMRHGTCAASIPRLSSERKFFSTVLSLFETKMNYDTHVLAKHGIVPTTTRRYKLQEFVEAFVTAWNVHPVMLCEEKHDHQVLVSLRTCLTKSLRVTECPDSVYERHSCHGDRLIYYLPSSLCT